jgi:hypothetical protein
MGLKYLVRLPQIELNYLLVTPEVPISFTKKGQTDKQMPRFSLHHHLLLDRSIGVVFEVSNKEYDHAEWT